MSDKFRNAVIFSDFDGTLSNGSFIPERNLRAIEYFKRNGGHFTLSTGRSPATITEVMPFYREVVNAPLIMANGALLYDSGKGEILEKYVMKEADCRKFIGELRENFGDRPFGYAVYGGGGESYYSPKEGETVGTWLKIRIDAPDEEHAVAYREYIKEKYSDKFNVFRSWYYCTEIVDIAASKGRHLDTVKRMFGENAFSCCVGDFENDTDMLKAGDYAFCPSSAIDDIKKICGKNVLCSRDDGCIADLIDYIERNLV